MTSLIISSDISYVLMEPWVRQQHDNHSMVNKYYQYAIMKSVRRWYSAEKISKQTSRTTVGHDYQRERAKHK